MDHFAVSLTYVLLALAIVALWLPSFSWREKKIPVWPVFFVAAVVSAMVYGLLTIAALAAIALLFAVSCGASISPRPLLRVPLLLATGVIALAFALHLFPGFANPSLNVGGFPIHLNFDKPTAGLALMAFLCRPNLSDWRSTARSMALPLVATVVTVFAVALAMHYVRFDFKIPEVTPVFLLTNLIFVCTTEEAFFRGLIQENLQQLLNRTAITSHLAVFIAAALFGLAHAGGGSTWVLLATVAGLGYGYAYRLTGKLEAAICTHFCVNAIHFIFFSYPSL